MKRTVGLRAKFAVLFLLMLTVFAGAMLLTVQLVSQTSIKKYVYNNLYARQHEMDKGVLMVLDEVNLLYSRMVFNDGLHQMVSGDFTPEEKRGLYAGMMEAVGINADIFGPVVCSIDGELYGGGDATLDLPPQSFISRVERSSNLLEQGGIVSQGKESYILIGKRMVNYPFSDTVGCAVFYVRELAVRERCGSISAELGHSFVVADGRMILSDQEAGNIGATFFDSDVFDFENTPNYAVKDYRGQKSIIIANAFSEINRRYGLNWNVVSVLSYERMFREIDNLNFYILGIGAAFLLIGGFAAFRVANRLTRPVNALSFKLRAFSETGKKPALPEPEAGEGDEILQLEKSYDEMVDRIENLIETNRREMEQQRKLELDSLQMQINPHFLYNTLDAIAWMAKIKRQPEIEKLVLSLAKFFRISLHKGDKYITVGEEVDMIRNFVEIERIRFPEQFDVVYEVEESVLPLSTLKLILQPIVENAVKHGVSQLDRKGLITVRACLADGDVVYEVEDDGAGFSPERELKARAKNTSAPGGYGLRNVDERIRLEYGPEYGVRVDSAPGKGTKVTLRIAARPFPESES